MPYLIVLAAGVCLGFLYYLLTPQLSLDNPGLWFLACVVAMGVSTYYAFRANAHNWNLGYGNREHKDNKSVGKAFVPGAAALVVLVLAGLASSSLLRADSYFRLLGEEKASDFKQSLPPIDLDNAPLVSRDMAQRAAEKKLSEIPALGSQTYVGALHKQVVGAKLYWVGFLQHRSVFSWSSQGATPGYVRVSATDPSDVDLVTEVAGKKLALRYLTSGYFGDDAERHLRFNGYASKGLTGFSPEVDDEGRPYTVATVFERRIGFAGHEAVGVAVLDVQSGSSQYYPLADVPKWVDRVQPEDFVAEQVADRLHLVHGWLNPSQKDRLAISGDVDLVYGKDGRSYFFAGMVSTAREGGLVGFMLVDTRTKEATRYSLVGVTEPIATAAAEGVYPEKKYSATNALPFVVDGVPVYVMALRDATGIARAYGIVSISDYQKVAVAESLSGAARLFQGQLNKDRTHVDAATRADEVQIKGVVVRVGSELRSGTSHYVLMLDISGTRLYTADANRAEDLSVTQAGDVVEIRTLDGEQRLRPILEFRNLTLVPLDALAVAQKSDERK